MKFYTRVVFLFVAFALLPLSFSYADDGQNDEKDEVITLEEAGALIEALPTAGDAVTGVVSTGQPKFYDIYGRQIAFRESAKALRASLDERRDNFAAPRVQALDGYRGTVKKVYSSETAAYQSSLENGSDEENDMDSDENDNVVISTDVSDDLEQFEHVPDDIASVDDVQDVDGSELVEKPIPSDSDEENAPKKKVVMPEDAPDFDPADL